MRFGYVPNRAQQLVTEWLGFDVSGRLIMPLYDPYGRIAFITTRDVRPDCDPKRKHWHESVEKSHYLYGIDLAKSALIEKKKAIVVEGQFDVAYLRTVGLDFTVGILGTALSLQQTTVISRYCSEIYLFFDGDDGGRKATARSMQMYMENGLAGWDIHFYPVETPDGKDPDEFSPAEIRDLCVAAKNKTQRAK